jgi:hypothetical protein
LHLSFSKRLRVTALQRTFGVRRHDDAFDFFSGCRLDLLAAISDATGSGPDDPFVVYQCFCRSGLLTAIPNVIFSP